MYVFLFVFIFCLHAVMYLGPVVPHAFNVLSHFFRRDGGDFRSRNRRPIWDPVTAEDTADSARTRHIPETTSFVEFRRRSANRSTVHPKQGGSDQRPHRDDELETYGQRRGSGALNGAIEDGIG